MTLLVRGQKTTRLTNKVRFFWGKRRKCSPPRNLAVEMGRRSARGESGTLRIGFFYGGNGPDVAAIIKNFRRLHPGVRVSVTDVLPGLQTKALLDGVIDVGFTRPLETPFDQLLRSQLLYLDALVAVFRAHRPVNLKSLALERFVFVAREIRSIALWENSGAVRERGLLGADCRNRRGMGERHDARRSRPRESLFSPAI